MKAVVVLLLVAFVLSLSGCADYAYNRGCNGPLPTLYKCR